MGCPDIYYRRMLQTLCYGLHNWIDDFDKAELIYEEKSTEILENEVNLFRERIGLAQLAFDAGRAAEIVSTESEKEGGDAFNACIGGFVEFEQFILGDEIYDVE